jgi:hypothetical protein
MTAPNLRAVQLLLGHTKMDSTVRYLGVELEDALAVQRCGAAFGLLPFENSAAFFEFIVVRPSEISANALTRARRATS